VSPEPIEPRPVLEDEDRARADLYALLARLYYQGPDPGVLAVIAQAGAGIPQETVSPLAAAWRSLASAAIGADRAAAQQEYDDLFIGTGRAEVSLYASYYLAETGREKILVDLRTELAAMGLSRKPTAREPEDHIAGLFDVMRHLVERGSADAALQDQRSFFERFIQPSYLAFCAAVEGSGRAEFYARVAALTRAFLDVEKEAIKML
jgi:TorA maturation chaperone TorD